MRNVDDLRQHSYCRACGLVVVDLVCPFCNSTIDEPVIYEAKIGYRSRFTSITGVFLLIVAGVTPAIVSASEKNESLSVSSRPVVVSTTTTAAPAKESTSTTVDRSSDQNTVQNTKTPTVQKPSRPANRTSTTLFQTTTTEELPLSGEHGKKLGKFVLWSLNKKDSYYSSLYLSIDKSEISLIVKYSRALTQSPCSNLEYQLLVSLDGGTTTSLTHTRADADCYAGIGTLYPYQYSSWRDPVNENNRNNAISNPPVPFHVKCIATAMGRVFETPWVLVNMNTVP